MPRAARHHAVVPRSGRRRARRACCCCTAFPEAAFVWDEVHRSGWRDGCRCVAPNLRGYERSIAPAEVEAYRAKHLVRRRRGADRAAPGAPIDLLVAHDWGGAVAWNLAAQQPELLQAAADHQLAAPGDLPARAARQPGAAGGQRLHELPVPARRRGAAGRRTTSRGCGRSSTGIGAASAWLTDAVREQYREVWPHGLDGALNYYRASPLRPPRADDDAVMSSRCPTKP